MDIKGKPETVFIAITCQDDSLAVMQFVTKQQRTLARNDTGDFIDPGWTREPTPENIEAEIAKANIPMKSWRICSYDELPADRTFRNAWKDAGKKVDVDMPKAREIHLERLRAARKELLRDLDDEERAPGANKVAIEARKQALRDVTKGVPTAKTPEELKAITV